MAPKGRGYKVTPPRVLELLRKAVEEKSQYAVAKETGLSLSVIQGLLKGNREPSTSTLTKLSNYFNIPLDLLRDDNLIKKSSPGISTIKPGAEIFEKQIADQLEEGYKKYGGILRSFFNTIPLHEWDLAMVVLKDIWSRALIEEVKEDLRCQGLRK